MLSAVHWNEWLSLHLFFRVLRLNKTKQHHFFFYINTFIIDHFEVFISRLSSRNWKFMCRLAALSYYNCAAFVWIVSVKSIHSRAFIALLNFKNCPFPALIYHNASALIRLVNLLFGWQLLHSKGDLIEHLKRLVFIRLVSNSAATALTSI